MQARSWAGLLTAMTMLAGAGPACAELDLTGRWTFTLQSPFGPVTECLDVVQADGVLSTADCTFAEPRYSGSIDVPSGTLTLSAPNDSDCAPTVITATAAPDGLTFSGTFAAEEHAC